MTSLVRSAPLDPGDPVHALLSLEQPEALHAAVNALDPEAAALAIGRAPSIQDKSRLVWAVEPERRTEILDQFHPGFVGALIQNSEAENKRLLGSVSREQFTRLLRYCSPERAYYWLTLATSFKDLRANMLPLLIPIDDLAAALLTQPEFENHCQEIGDYDVDDLSMDNDYFQEIASATVTVRGPDGTEEFSIRDPRLRQLLHDLEYEPEGRDAVVEIMGPEGTLHALPLGDPRLRRLLDTVLNRDPEQYAAITNAFGPEGMLREFRVREPRLRRLLQTILDHDPEHYAALIHAALRLADYEANHPEERDVVCEDPILLDSLLTLDEERAQAGLAAPPRAPEVPVNGGETMTFISRSAALDPGDPVQVVLSCEEPEALHAAINAMDLEDAAMVIGRAPSIEDKSRLVWALEPDRRAEVLDQFHPGFVGALIQNSEAQNKRLLGSVSREQFTRLLRYCSPERAYYWLTLATSFEDARANLLPLLVPLHDLAAALLTQPEFETHCQRIGDYSVEDLGLDLGDFKQGLALAIVGIFGADGMLREFPLRDPRLRQLLQIILDHDPEQYAALIVTALQFSDYAADRDEERAALQEDPILLEDLLSLDEERSRAGL